jgi:hypothetical protein
VPDANPFRVPSTMIDACGCPSVCNDAAAAVKMANDAYAT